MSRSVVLSWSVPDDSLTPISQYHVCADGVVRAVVQLNGLSPSTIYRVSVRTKHPKAVLEQRPVERCVDFKTLPKSIF
uniref:Fibronectin type-III domain-containing protein n=1 Tax=Parascaris equorum TaxID=6256 RepID=A0A914RYX0_PAREQ